VGTQMDGLGHVGIGDVFFNGFDRKEFVTTKGLTKLGVENVGVFLTRGVLLDIAALKNVKLLDKGYEITEADLREALRRQKVQIRSGDAVFLHTGWGTLWQTNNQLFISGQPGIGPAAARFLASQQVVLVGSDNWGIDVLPAPWPDLVFPAHQILITQNGIHTLENLDLSELARDKAYEFAFFFAPLRMKGATGSPGNPVAIR
jgi:kynurenine formamidase